MVVRGGGLFFQGLFRFKRVRRFFSGIFFIKFQNISLLIKKLLLISLLLGSLYLFFTSNFFKIQQIDLVINQNDYIDIEKNKRFIKQETLAKNIFQINIRKLSKQIVDQDSFIQEVLVNKVLPNRLKIIITEDRPVIKAIDEKKCLLINIKAKELWQGEKSDCLLILLPQVLMSKNRQIYYNKIYLQYIIKFNNYMLKNEQVLPFSYKVIANPKVYLQLNFKSHKVLLDMDIDVLYNWYRYSLVQKNLALKDYKNKTIDLTHKDVVIY